MSRLHISLPHYLSLPGSWEALAVSQHAELVFSVDAELPVITPGGRPAAALSPEPLGGVGRLGAVALLAPTELLGLNGVAEPGPGEDAGHASGEGDLAGAAPHVDAVGSGTDLRVASEAMYLTAGKTHEGLSWPQSAYCARCGKSFSKKNNFHRHLVLCARYS